MTKTNFEKVGEFHSYAGVANITETKPTWPDETTRELRIKLIQEELQELQEAIRDENIVEVADALSDLLYVVYGAGHCFGLNLDETFAEVHRSNMTKFPNGQVLRREDGKIMKPASWEPPNIAKIIDESLVKSD